MKTNILITGGTGYIGSNLIKRLVHTRRFQITAIYHNRLPKENIREVNWVKYNGDYKSLNLIGGDTDIIIHLATYFKSNHSTEDIGKLINSNILFGTHLLEYAKRNKINKFINTSSYAQSIDNSSYNPQNLYTATKEAFEDILKYYIESGVVKSITLSLFDTYGPNDSRPKFINLVIDALDKDIIFNMSPGGQQISYVYIEDVVNAYCQALDLLLNNKIEKSKAFSVIGCETMSLNDLVKYVSRTMGKKLQINRGFYSYREREIMKSIPKYEILPNWEAKVKISEGVKRIIKDNENRKDKH